MKTEISNTDNMDTKLKVETKEWLKCRKPLNWVTTSRLEEWISSDDCHHFCNSLTSGVTYQLQDSAPVAIGSSSRNILSWYGIIYILWEKISSYMVSPEECTGFNESNRLSIRPIRKLVWISGSLGDLTKIWLISWLGFMAYQPLKVI